MTPDLLIWILPLLAVLGLALRAASPQDRRGVRFAWGLCAASAALWLVNRLVGAAWTIEAAGALAQLAGIHLGAILLFHVLLRRWHPPEIADDLAIGAGYVFVFFTLLSRIGVNVTGLIATSAVATAVVGFAMQDMLANLAGGLTLEFEQSIREGDWIETERGLGCVRAVRMRHIAVETPDGDTLLVPNNTLMKSPVKVLGRLPGQAGGALKHRKLVSFSLPYQHDPPAVVEAVEQAFAAAPIEGVWQDPPARCVVLQYQPRHADYGLLVWLSRPGLEYVDSSAVRTRLFYALQRAGAPLTTIPAALEVRYQGGPADETAARVEALRGVDLFRTLSDEEARGLAGRLHRASYAPGEIILRQGDAGDSLFVLAGGRVAVSISAGSGLPREIARLSPGQVFGEMSLLTGEPRSATVSVLERAECYWVARDDLTGLLAARPELARQFSEILARRQRDLGAARERLESDAAVAASEAGLNGGDLLRRIQRWFRLA